MNPLAYPMPPRPHKAAFPIVAGPAPSSLKKSWSSSMMTSCRPTKEGFGANGTMKASFDFTASVSKISSVLQSTSIDENAL